MRWRAEAMLRQLKAQDDESHLDDLAAEYRKRFGKYPSSTADLRAAGLLNGIPVDPKGYPYVFGPDGKAALDSRSPLVVSSELKTAPEASK